MSNFHADTQYVPGAQSGMMDGEEDERQPGSARGGWAQALKFAIGGAVQIAGRVQEVMSSASELLADKELRRKGAAFLISEAQKGLQELHKGIRSNSGAFAKMTTRQQLQNLMSRIEAQISEHRREKQLRAHRKQLVDVQVGALLFEGMPQEVRTRMWFVLLENPALAEALKPSCRHPPTVVPSPASPAFYGGSRQSLDAAATCIETSEVGLSTPIPRPPVFHTAGTPFSGGVTPAPMAGATPLALPAAPVVSGPLALGLLDLPQPNDAFSAGHSGAGATAAAAPPAEQPRVSASDVASGAPAIADLLGMDDMEPVQATPALASGPNATPAEAVSQNAGDLASAVGKLSLSGAAGAGAAQGSTARPAVATSARHKLASQAHEPFDIDAAWFGGAEAPSSGGASTAGAPTATAESDAHRTAPEQQAGASTAAPDGPEGTTLDVDAAAGGDHEGEWEVLPSPDSPSSYRPPASQPAAAPPDDATALIRALLRSMGSSMTLSVEALNPGANASGVAGAPSVAPGATAAAAPGASGDLGPLAGVSGSAEASSVPGAAPSPPGSPTGPAGALAAGASGSEVWEDTEQEARRALFEAMLLVPWVPGLGVPHDYPPDSRFAMLNEMTAGQEEVDDVILRDIGRTYPGHPQFSADQGQQSLFRVLKAYSVHDLEVAYCQGMAFSAGVLLMYLPEEPAFRLYCRLMDVDGPNLRRLYLPGLDPLKHELAKIEHLMAATLPELHAHLVEHGVPPVLYASQWLMTLYATPFPPAFCARLIDILLQDGHDRVMIRLALAILEELNEAMLAMDDFEQLLTHLKVAPANWGPQEMNKLLERALSSYITDEDIQSASDHVAAETARLQREREAAAGAASPGPGGQGAAPHHHRHHHGRHQSGEGVDARHGSASHPSSSSQQPLGTEAAGTSHDASDGGAGSAPLGGRISGNSALPALDLEDEYLDLLLDLDLLAEGGRPSSALSADVDAMAADVFGAGHKQQ